MKEKEAVFSVNGKEYKAVFNLNVMQEIQIEYETFARWGELTDGKGEKGEVDIKALIFGIKAMLNEAIDIENEALTDNKKPYLTEKQVGRLITEMGLKEATQKLNSTVINSTKDDKPKNE